jgi:ferritin-like metal-binding protein YciE
MIDDLIVSTDDPEIVADFKRHKQATYRHVRRLEGRLSAHDSRRSLIGDVTAIAGSLIRTPIAMLRPEPTGRSVSDAYTREHAEIAAYELLERIADMVGDGETAKVARENRADEEDMVRRIERNWDQVAEQALAESGVIVVPNKRVAARAASSPNGKSSARRGTRQRGTAHRANGRQTQKST